MAYAASAWHIQQLKTDIIGQLVLSRPMLNFCGTSLRYPINLLVTAKFFFRSQNFSYSFYWPSEQTQLMTNNILIIGQSGRLQYEAIMFWPVYANPHQILMAKSSSQSRNIMSVGHKTLPSPILTFAP
jgi:hypothetical protein